MDTPDKRGIGYGFCYSPSSGLQHGHHHYHPYRRNEKKYFPDEFKKGKPLTFDGELEKLEDAEAWLFGMKKFF